MKKLFVSMAITAGFTGSAFAADLPMKAAPMAPAQVIAANWTGCYVGAGGGYGMFVQRHRSVDVTGLAFTAGGPGTRGNGAVGPLGGGCACQNGVLFGFGGIGGLERGGLGGEPQPPG